MTIDLQDAAARLGVSYATARKWASSGVLPAFHLVGRRKWSVDVRDLEQFIAAWKAGPEVGPKSLRKRTETARNVAGQCRQPVQKGQWMEEYAGKA